jgi:hypothetical protein
MNRSNHCKQRRISLPTHQTTINLLFLAQRLCWITIHTRKHRCLFLATRKHHRWGLRFSDVTRCHSRCHWVTDVWDPHSIESLTCGTTNMWGPHVSDSMAPRMAPNNVTESQSHTWLHPTHQQSLTRCAVQAWGRGDLGFLQASARGKSSSKDLCDGCFLYYLIHPYFDNLPFHL